VPAGGRERRLAFGIREGSEPCDGGSGLPWQAAAACRCVHGRKALLLMGQNLWFTVVYNFLTVPVAIAGVVTRLIAAYDEGFEQDQKLTLLESVQGFSVDQSARQEA